MSNVVREGVEGIGISHDIPQTLCKNPYFTEVAIPETVKIPDVKPDMEELLSVMVEAKIISLRIINTPKGTSQEGQHLTGKKLSIELELNQKIKYIADEPTQSVHSAHFSKKVSSIWIVVPEKLKDEKGICTKIETLLAQGKLVVTPYIEDIYGEQLDKRTVFKNTTLLITVNSVCDSLCNKADLVLTKTAPDFAKANVPFTYTLKIENTGCQLATNVTLKDTISGGNHSYVANSFTIDGISIPGVDPTSSTEVSLGDIPPCTTVTVTYQIKGTTASTRISNAATITYLDSQCSDATLKTTSDSTTITITA